MANLSWIEMRCLFMADFFELESEIQNLGAVLGRAAAGSGQSIPADNGRNNGDKKSGKWKWLEEMRPAARVHFELLPLKGEAIVPLSSSSSFSPSRLSKKDGGHFVTKMKLCRPLHFGGLFFFFVWSNPLQTGTVPDRNEDQSHSSHSIIIQRRMEQERKKEREKMIKRVAEEMNYNLLTCSRAEIFIETGCNR